MAKLDDFFFGVKRVDESCFDIFEPFYEERERHYVYPVYYQSITQMIGAGGFFYKIFQRNGSKTLAIFKRSAILGNYSIMLHIAPINLDGSKQEEVAIMQEARRYGVTLKVCYDDIKRYKLPMKICEPIKGNCEYVYNASHISELKGSEFRTFRFWLRKIQKLEGYRHSFGVNDDITRMVKAWDERNKKRGIEGVQSPQWNNMRKIRNSKVIIHSIYSRERIEVFGIIERISSKHWTVVKRVRNYNSPLKDVNRPMHILDCQIASKDAPNVVYANFGATRGQKGLAVEKESLHPCYHQQIYKVASINKLNAQAIKKYFV